MRNNSGRPGDFRRVVRAPWRAWPPRLSIAADLSTCLAGTANALSITMWRSTLLKCGIVAAVLYTAMTLFAGMLWDGYSAGSQTISELSAIDAPKRALWVALGTVYTVLIFAFGWMVWKSAPPNRALRLVGVLLMLHGVFGAFWPPMHQRVVLAATGGTLTDTLHVVWAGVTGLFFLSLIHISEPTRLLSISYAV